MTDETPTTMDLAYVDGLIQDIKHRGDVPKAMRVGTDLQEAFIAAAGDAYAGHAYRGIPVTFDAIDPEGISIDSEPA
ncbi:hypothetical protein [Brevundimonas bullata]|uniref:hypothetical protein n=1 Tax=Brevundimonas bullata TaxID=13160 RepID=UPI003D9A49F6